MVKKSKYGAPSGNQNAKKPEKSKLEKRIITLIANYKYLDKKYNRGITTLTKDELLELINNGCYWCGETNKDKLGADRLDNTKPHTKENCVCSCKKCNVKRGRTKRILQYTKDGILIKEWECVKDIEKELGYDKINIRKCCCGYYGCKTLKGFIWKYK